MHGDEFGRGTYILLNSSLRSKGFSQSRLLCVLDAGRSVVLKIISPLR
jgi:hypothetical protein